MTTGGAVLLGGAVFIRKDASAHGRLVPVPMRDGSQCPWVRGAITQGEKRASVLRLGATVFLERGAVPSGMGTSAHGRGKIVLIGRARQCPWEEAPMPMREGRQCP